MAKELDIVEALRLGSVPEQGACEICVGRDPVIDEIKRQLELAQNGKAPFKFISGHYGAGKSFMLQVVSELAYLEDFAVSDVKLSRDTPFNKFEEVYRKIVQGIRDKDGNDIKGIIDAWWRKERIKAMDETPDPIRQNRLVSEFVAEKLEAVRFHENSLAVAIENYFDASLKSDTSLASYAIAWIKGNSNIPYQAKRRFGVKGDITKENAFAFLKAIASLLVSIGHSGIVITIDELDIIMATILRTDLRNAAYHNIRVILDNCADGTFQNIFFVFAALNDLFQEGRYRSIPETYTALWDRIKPPVDSPLNYQNVKNPIIEVERLGRGELKNLSQKIITLHAKAYDWEPNLSERLIDSVLIEYEDSAGGLTGGKLTPREYIRGFIDLLDKKQQYDLDEDALWFAFAEGIEQIIEEEEF